MVKNKKIDTTTTKHPYKNNTYALRNYIINNEHVYKELVEQSMEQKEKYSQALKVINEVKDICVKRGRF